MILRANGIEPLIKIVMNSNNKNTIKHGSWALSNLCRGRPLPNFKYTAPAIPVFCKVLKEESDAEVLTDAAWALSYLSDGDDKRIQLVLNTGVLPFLVKLLAHPFLSILIPIVRTIGNIATGSDEQTNQVYQTPLALE
jgi:importin subunit alpha-1